MTALFKIVDGVQIDLSPAEVDAYHSQQAEAEAQRAKNLQQSIVAATQTMLDNFAATRLYGGIMSACTYVSSTNPKFAAEGAYCVELRDQTWAKLYEMLAEVQAGSRPIPSSFTDIAGELPVSSATWPV